MERAEVAPTHTTQDQVVFGINGEPIFSFTGGGDIAFLTSDERLNDIWMNSPDNSHKATALFLLTIRAMDREIQAQRARFMLSPKDQALRGLEYRQVLRELVTGKRTVL